MSKVSTFSPSEIWSKDSFDQSNTFTSSGSRLANTAPFERLGLPKRPQEQEPPTESTEAHDENFDNEADLILPAAPLDDEPEYVKLDPAELGKLLAEAEKKGREAERNELQEKNKNEIDSLKKTLELVIDASSKAIADKEPLIEELTELSFRIGQLLAKVELHHSSQQVHKFIRQLLSTISDEDKVDISLMYPEEWSDALNGLNIIEEFPNVKFRSDNGLTVGSVIMHYGNGGLIDLFEERAESLQREMTEAVYEHSKPSITSDQALDLENETETPQTDPISDG